MSCIHENKPGRCGMCRQDRLEERWGVPEDHIDDDEDPEEVDP